MDSKNTGSYYTPHKLVQAMIDYVNIEENISILEPSGGDGRIVKQILENVEVDNIDIVEIIEDKSKLLKQKFIKNSNVHIINEDFLEYCKYCDTKYDLIIGNPPYINKKLLSEAQIELAKILCDEFSLHSKATNNIWVMFIIGALKLLKQNGQIMYILPFEFLQVEYSKEVRNLLEQKFSSIEVFVFEQEVFSNIQQKVCLLSLSNLSNKPYIEYNEVSNFNLKKPILKNKIYKNKPLDKWTNSIIGDDEIEFINKLKKMCISVNDIGTMSPGVVTGVNEFFIKDKSFVELINNVEYFEKIVPKSSLLRNCFILSEEVYEDLYSKNEKVSLLKLNNKNNFSKDIKEYLRYGQLKEYNDRYKCKQRKPWYKLPEDRVGDLLFFKRYDKIPRVIVNQAKCHTTDAGYNIKIAEKYDVNSVAFCFYNSLTLFLCEYNCRFYAGGVAELTPNELRSVYILYRKIHHKQVKKLGKMIENGIRYEKIIEYVDSVVFHDLLKKDDIDKIRDIRKRYLDRRLK